MKLRLWPAMAIAHRSLRETNETPIAPRRMSLRNGATHAASASEYGLVAGRLPVTCTIIAKDEADRIELAIKSVADLVDEILVVDSGSTDGTVELCEALGARVVFNTWEGFGPQKRFAEDQARNDWILNLDADERLSDAARSEIRRFLADVPPATTAVRIRTRLVYPRRDAPCLFADFHNYIRLYNRHANRFRNSLTHDEVLPAGKVVQLRGEIFHASFRSVAHIVRKMLTYAELQQREARGATRPLGLRVFCELPFQFFKYYFLRRHVFGGRAGFVFAMSLAASRWLRLLVISGW